VHNTSQYGCICAPNSVKRCIYKRVMGNCGCAAKVRASLTKKWFMLSESASVFDRAELFERFLKVVFSVSGFDRFSYFERVLQFDTESAEKLGGDSFLAFDTESV